MNNLKSKIIILYHYLLKRHSRAFTSRIELELWQGERLQKILKKISKSSRFYQKSLTPYLEGNKRWHDIPIINKKIMMENFDELNTLGVKKDDAFKLALEGEKSRNFSHTLNGVTIGLSSGTSGNRGLFVVGALEQARYTGAIIAKIFPRSIFGTHRVAYFLRSDSNLYKQGKNSRLQFKFFDMIRSIDKNIEDLNEYNPTMLLAPPSMLRQLARAQEKGTLRIYPEKIISIAEVLEPIDKEHIECAFKQIIHQIYQCTEGFLATTCEHGTLHLNEDLIFFEKEFINKERTKFVPIITDLYRIGQPYVRYRLNDVLNLKKAPCPCGSVHTALESIEGRCDDIFYFLPQNSMESKFVPVFSDFIRRSIMFSTEEILEYIVRQDSLTRLNVTLKLDNASDKILIEERIREEFSKLALEMNFMPPAIDFNYNFLPLGLNKQRRIQRNFDLSTREELY